MDIREDGSFRLNMDYFGYMDGLRMTNDKFNDLFGGSPRSPESDISKREMDLAKSIQTVTEEILMKMVRYAHAMTGRKNLCLAGGVALNCVANGKICREGIFDNVWIQPAAGDAGGALGAALYVWHHVMGNERTVNPDDAMAGAFLGPGFSADLTKAFLDANNLPYKEMSAEDRDVYIAKAVDDAKVIGLLEGRMEFGPRALCHRSIIADARSKKMQSYLNLATKFRESFRPFAPVVLREDCGDYFETNFDSPYMLLVDQVCSERCIPEAAKKTDISLKEWVNTPRSDVPAITHVDFSARVQTVDKKRNPSMHNILVKFKELTGCSVMVNTSFNVRGEPIVCTPEDAYRCFMRTGIDILVLDHFVLEKTEQPEWEEVTDWREEFTLD